MSYTPHFTGAPAEAGLGRAVEGKRHRLIVLRIDTPQDWPRFWAQHQLQSPQRSKLLNLTPVSVFNLVSDIWSCGFEI